jgi:ferredoxin--NADP+ reductase
VFNILDKVILSDVNKLMVIDAPEVANKAQAGQFVIVRIDEWGERIPLTIADFDRDQGTITIVFQEVGKSTMKLGTMEAGDEVASFVGPLGLPSEIENFGTVVCVGGGVGIAPMYPIARALKEAGNTVLGIIGSRNKELLFWEDRMREVCDELTVCTDDGSYGRKALVTMPLQEILEARAGVVSGQVARVWAIGPAIMMKFCARTTEPFRVPTIVSLNSIMVDGTGMCGACRVEVGGQTKFVCVDGPEFDGYLVDWDLLMLRQRIYLAEEGRAKDAWMEQSAREHACADRDQSVGAAADIRPADIRPAGIR